MSIDRFNESADRSSDLPRTSNRVTNPPTRPPHERKTLLRTRSEKVRWNAEGRGCCRSCTSEARYGRARAARLPGGSKWWLPTLGGAELESGRPEREPADKASCATVGPGRTGSKCASSSLCSC